MKQILDELYKIKDTSYGDFQSKLIPNIERERIIGIRTMELRKCAKRIVNEPYIDEFLNELPHKYYDENNLHGELLKLKYKNYDEFIKKLEQFLPYVDNWATCDMLSPKIFKKHTDEVYERIKIWIKSTHTYTVRFAIVTLMGYFLDDAFLPEQMEMAAKVRSEEYYIKMAVAWYMSVAVIKQYDTAIKYLEDRRLDAWTHNKAIQKSIESLRIDADTKLYLRTLKIKM